VDWRRARHELGFILRRLAGRRRAERELDEEIRAHLELEIQENVERGMSPEEARSAALRAFGSVALAKEESRMAWGLGSVETLWQDLKFGARVLRRSPGFTAAAVLSLALGVGANSTVFTFLNAVVLRPLPYPDPERLVVIRERPLASGDTVSVHPFNFLEWRDRARSFEALALTQSIPVNTMTPDGAEQIHGLWLTSELFRVFGVAPAAGREFAAEETVAGGPSVVILGHGFWQRRFAADPGVVGQTVVLNDKAQTVVGVMPSNFRVASLEPDVYLPMPLDRANPQSIGSRSFVCYGRLKPGVGVAAAQAEMSVIAGQLASQYPLDKGYGAAVFGLHQYLVKESRPILLLLLGVVGAVLLIACANQAGLLLTRGVGRRSELAVRAALGASRPRLVRQLVAESLLLSTIGGAAGLLLGHWGTQLLLALSKEAMTFGRVDEVRLDFHVLGFTLALSALSGLLFGLVPAWYVSRLDLQTVLKEQGRGAAGDRRHNRFRSALVIVEVALAVVLLVGAGLLLRNFSRLLQVDLGFRPEQVLTMQLFLPYPAEAKRAGIVEEILRRVEALPNVRAAGTIHFLPIGGMASKTGFRFEGRPEPEPSQSLTTEGSVVSQGYFAAMGIPLLQGRLFGPQDRAGSPRVVIINQSFLKKFFPQGDALGRRIVVQWSNEAATEVVGVVGDVRHNGLTAEPQPTVFLLNAQTPRYVTFLVIRAATDPTTLAAAVRHEVRQVDRTQAITAVKTMEQYVGESVARPRLHAILLGAFAGLAMLLAAVGLYGVVAYTVTQRTHEIGIRVALGARRGDILRMVVGQGLALALTGVALGLAGAFAGSRLLATFLYGVSTTDPLTFVSAPSLLAVVALAACYFPARRATRVDPMAALRYE